MWCHSDSWLQPRSAVRIALVFIEAIPYTKTAPLIIRHSSSNVGVTNQLNTVLGLVLSGCPHVDILVILRSLLGLAAQCDRGTTPEI